MPNNSRTIAILWGVSEYKNSAFRNAPPINGNVLKMKQVLQDSKILGLTDDDFLLIEGKLSSVDILNKIGDFLEKQYAENAIFYYAGHGIPTNSEYYLATYESDIKYTNKNSISWTEIRELFESGNGITRRLYILDACYAGKAHLSADTQSYDFQVLDGSALLAASDADKKAYFDENEPLTYFTQALTDTLIKGIGTEESADLLLEPLAEKLNLLLKDKDFKVEIKSTNQIRRYPFFKNTSHDPFIKEKSKIKQLLEEGKKLLKSADNEGALSKFLVAKDKAQTIQGYLMTEIENQIKYCKEIEQFEPFFDAKYKARITELLHKISALEIEKQNSESENSKLKEEITQLKKQLAQYIKEADKIKKYTETAAGIPFEMLQITAGEFQMGSPDTELDRYGNETQHWVKLSDFYMSQFTVTQELYEKVTGNNPANFTENKQNPVEMVSWYEALEFCNKLSEKAGFKPYYTIDKNRKDDNNKNEDKNDTLKYNVTRNLNANGYRLPTEAEWEYACRAGTTTPFNTGDNLSTDQANYNGDYPYKDNTGKDFPKGEYRQKTTPVGFFTNSANTFGLCDMHGNVLEWCWDWKADYHSTGNKATDISANTNPTGAPSGYSRVLRGGSWNDDARSCRSAYRNVSTPSHRGSNIGFRLCRNE